MTNTDPAIATATSIPYSMYGGQPTHNDTDTPCAHYRFRAVIDWIELRIVTAKPSNFDTVKKRMGVAYVKPVNPGDGGATTEFVFRIQDPKNWTAIDACLAAFTHDHPLAGPVQVTGIEIALDAYSKRHSRDDLVQMTGRFYKFASRIVSANRRLSRGHRDTHGMPTFPGLLRRLGDGYNVYIGNQRDPVHQHIYLKETNVSNGAVVALPAKERRARTEFTLSGDGLPYTTLDAWRQHDFTTHSDFFNFRAFKPFLIPPLSRALAGLDQVGERRARPRPGRGKRFFSKSTVADKKLNDLAYSALRELTKRMTLPG